MNDDDPQQLLAELKAEHRQLDSEIAALTAGGVATQMELARLKKRKLRLKDEIQLLADQTVPDIIA